MIKGIPFTGSKYKLIEQLKPYLERPQFTMFYDMMCGGGSVAVNLDYERLHLNDINMPLIHLLSTITLWGRVYTITMIDSIVKLHELDAANKLAYMQLRQEYNSVIKSNPDNPINPYILLTLIYHSYNNMIRFNKQGRFNVPFGQRTFNEQARSDLVPFIDTLMTKKVTFTSSSIGVWDYAKEPDDVLFYFDVPYSVGNAAYNTGWTQKTDTVLFQMLDYMHSIGKSWALSNAFANNGQQNYPLMEWAAKYDVINIDHTYNGSYVNRKNEGSTREVLIKNYD